MSLLVLRDHAATKTNQGHKDDHKQHTHWFSVQLRVLAKLPVCSSACQTTRPQGILVYLDGTHIEITVSKHIMELLLNQSENH